MKTLLALILISVLLVVQFHYTKSFTFPSILDDAREAMMKFSTGTVSSKPSTTSSSYKPSFRISRPSSRRRRSSWGRRRRRSLPSPSPRKHKDMFVAFSASKITHVSSIKIRTTPSNNFLEILSKVERSILEAQASGNRRTSLRKLTSSIKLALTNRNYLFARQALGQALYGALYKNRRGKRSAASGGKTYLIKLKNEVGEGLFNKLIGFNDEKTLMFAIDDTGSMGNEISAVKSISTSIVNSQAGKMDIDYILSVFNDPTVGPVVRKENGKEFINELNKLRAHGGGDYPELTFTGMLKAMEKGPQEGSPMFVFTDATSKDHKTYKDTVIQSAKEFGVNINFFTTSSAASFAPFVEAAKETCGMILRLTGSHEIRKLESITKLSLKSYACMLGGSGNGSSGKKRSVSKSHLIKVDDSVEKMIVSVSAQNPNPVVTLRDPYGRVQSSGKISLRYATIYELFNPTAGRWSLTVATTAGRYHFLVRGNSKTNIDFDYYFVMTSKGRGKKVPIPISQPLSGQVANTIITVTGVEKIQTKNLKLDLIEKNSGRVLKTLTLRQRRRSKAHFMVSFTPPSTPFKLQLRGRTLAGNPFERSSRRTIQALAAIVRVYKAMNGQLALPRGRRMYVIMKIFNNGPTEKFDVSINDPLGYSTSRRKQVVKVKTNRNRRFIMWFSASRTAKPGKAYPVAVTITGRKTGVKAAQILNMIVT